MATIAFDTLKYSKRLKDAGVPEKQAEAEALAEVLEINLNELTTKRDMKEMETALRRDLGEAESRLKHDLELMRLDLRDLERRMTIKLGGLMVVAVGAVAALVKLL